MQVSDWLVQLQNPDPHLRIAAAEAIGLVATEYAPQGLHALVNVLSTPIEPLDGRRDYQYSVVEILGDPTEIDTDAAVKVAAATALRRFGQIATEAVPALIAMFDCNRTDDGASGLPSSVTEWTQSDLEPFRRMMAVSMGDLAMSDAAVNALAAIGKSAVGCLIEALVETSSNRRSAAARALGAIGPDAKEALPVLTRMAAFDDFEGARNMASDAIRLIAR